MRRILKLILEKQRGRMWTELGWISIDVSGGLLRTWQERAKRSFTVSVKTPNGTEDKTTLKGTTRMARVRGSAS
jgi:hypothetical protein